ncbi:hypothetical protein BRAS3843_1020007 [Bradyrhizobium sp. STM 3843]|nr:hypothetical protein BRAS3843_1020007 [Bradyrhizobium sp. STM 3843]
MRYCPVAERLHAPPAAVDGPFVRWHVPRAADKLQMFAP